VKSLTLEIPKEIILSLKLPREGIKQELLKELAVILYERKILALGKARELAKMSRWEFQQELGKRKIPRHYTEKELGEDIEFARKHGNQ